MVSVDLVREATEGDQSTKCPVCEGKGRVPIGFYETAYSSKNTDALAENTCRSCGGKGYIFIYESLFSEKGGDWKWR